MDVKLDRANSDSTESSEVADTQMGTKSSDAAGDAADTQMGTKISDAADTKMHTESSDAEDIPMGTKQMSDADTEIAHLRQRLEAEVKKRKAVERNLKAALKVEVSNRKAAEKKVDAVSEFVLRSIPIEEADFEAALQAPDVTNAMKSLAKTATSTRNILGVGNTLVACFCFKSSAMILSFASNWDTHSNYLPYVLSTIFAQE